MSQPHQEYLRRQKNAVDLYNATAEAAKRNMQFSPGYPWNPVEPRVISTPRSDGDPVVHGITLMPVSTAPLGSGQIAEYATGAGENDEGIGGPRQPPTGRPRRPSQPMQRRLMGSAGGGGLNQHFQNQRTASSWEQLQRKPSAWENMQRRNSYMPQSQQTPRQRFTA